MLICKLVEMLALAAACLEKGHFQNYLAIDLCLILHATISYRQGVRKPAKIVVKRSAQF